MTRKLLFSIILSIIVAVSAVSQETALDFNQPDCNGTQHHLFSELDAGKVVILEFVMLNCAPCITATKSLEKIKGLYQDSHPGRVVLYSMGFLNAYTCNQMNSWMTNNNFTHTVFTGGEEQVAYYGGMGMPTIVVLGSNEHTVYFKSSGYSPSLDPEIRAGIETALTYNPLGIRDEIQPKDFIVYPTISTGEFKFDIHLQLNNLHISLFNNTGTEVLSLTATSGINTVNLSKLPSGMYIARLKSKEGYSRGIKLIKQ